MTRISKISNKLNAEFQDFKNSLDAQDRLDLDALSDAASIESFLDELSDMASVVEDLKRQFAEQLFDYMIQEEDSE